MFMRKAIILAAKGKGNVSPNPMVGCIIVKKNKIIGAGYHKIFGGPHAEIEALKDCASPAGSDMYVNLEPCCHYNKKTVPCVPEIIKSGIKRIFVAMKDPNPNVNGRGLSQLRRSGIQCCIGHLGNEAERLNETYIKYVTTNMPFVTLKTAYSFDLKTHAYTGDSRWISSVDSREYVHKMRTDSDGVLVGIKTVLCDDPALTSHGAGKNPVRIVLDTHLRIPLSAKILDDKSKTVVATSFISDHKKKRVLENMGIIILELPLKNKKLDLKRLLSKLAELNISSILVEGGEEVTKSFMEEKLFDRRVIFICPLIIGRAKKIKDSAAIKQISVINSGRDIMLQGDIDV